MQVLLEQAVLNLGRGARCKMQSAIEEAALLAGQVLEADPANSEAAACLKACGEQYLEGDRVPRDVFRGSELLDQAYRSGNVEAALRLGCLYHEQRDLLKCALLWEEARSRGMLEVTLELGKVYDEIGDSQKAMAFFKEAMALFKEASLGDTVKICGLTNPAALHLNGCRGRAQSFDDRTGRFGVLVYRRGVGMKAIRPRNLVFVGEDIASELVESLEEFKFTDRFLPEFIRGKRVIFSAGAPGHFQVDNCELQDSASTGVQLRLSRDFDDRDVFTAEFGRTLKGVLSDGWLHIQVPACEFR